MREVRRHAVLALIVLIAGCASTIADTPLALRLGPDWAIPEGYKTYVLFLNASTEYPDHDAPSKLEALERHFKSFGDSIGDSHLAVWVSDGSTRSLSVSRGKHYIDLASRRTGAPIHYSDGPFVIVSSRHPRHLADAMSSPADPAAIVIAFRGIRAERIIEVLNFLESRIRRDEALTPAKFRLPVLWVRLQSWWDTTDHEFFKKVALTLLDKTL